MAETSRASGAEVTTKPSPFSVTDTVAKLEAVASAKGMKVFAVIDHSGEARRAGLDLPDTKVVIVGSPKAGTPVMQSAPLAALDLPLKVLVWDDHGQTTVAYAAPGALASRYGVAPELAKPLDGLGSLVDAATSPDKVDETLS